MTTERSDRKHLELESAKNLDALEDEDLEPLWISAGQQKPKSNKTNREK